jgi:hypothetical protein
MLRACLIASVHLSHFRLCDLPKIPTHAAENNGTTEKSYAACKNRKTGDRRVIEYLVFPVMQAVKEAGRERSALLSLNSEWFALDNESGAEGGLMAPIEHRNIVKVFSEKRRVRDLLTQSGRGRRAMRRRRKVWPCASVSA